MCVHSPADAAAPADAPLPDSVAGARPAGLCATGDISSGTSNCILLMKF